MWSHQFRRTLKRSWQFLQPTRSKFISEGIGSCLVMFPMCWRTNFWSQGLPLGCGHHFISSISAPFSCGNLAALAIEPKKQICPNNFRKEVYISISSFNAKLLQVYNNIAGFIFLVIFIFMRIDNLRSPFQLFIKQKSAYIILLPPSLLPSSPLLIFSFIPYTNLPLLLFSRCSRRADEAFAPEISKAWYNFEQWPSLPFRL